MTCPEGKELSDGLCYDRCKNGTEGFGPLCWGRCSIDTKQCGTLCISHNHQCTEYLSEVTKEAITTSMITDQISHEDAIAKNLHVQAPESTLLACETYGTD